MTAKPSFSRLSTWLISGVSSGCTVVYWEAKLTSSGPKSSSNGWNAAAEANASAENGPKSGANAMRDWSPPCTVAAGKGSGQAGRTGAVEPPPTVVVGVVEVTAGDVVTAADGVITACATAGDVT